MSKMLDKINALPAGAASERNNTRGPLSAPGRMFEFSARIEEAETKAATATRDAEEARRQLEEAKALIAKLEQSGTSGAAMVKLSLLVRVPGRQRLLSPEERAELKANLEANELIHPIVYRQLDDGRKEIVSGHNRAEIYEELGRDEIFGVPFEGDARSAELGATFANLLAPSLPDFEKFRQFERLQSESGFTRSDIIEASGISKGHVSRIFAFEKLPVAARQAIATRPDRIGGAAALEFAALATDGRDELVTKAIEALISNDKLTQKSALEMAKPKAAPKSAAPTIRTINIGKRKLCDVSMRGGVVALRFSGKNGEQEAAKWIDRIEALIRESIDRADD